MRSLEKRVAAIRHSRTLEHRHRLWSNLRPAYEWTLRRLNPKGLRRSINGTDHVLIDPRFRQIPEVYEPDVWPRIMSSVRQGDCVVDVGAYVGLYSIAMANRVGPEGEVHAFEPDAENFAALQKHAEMNDVSARLRLYPKAVGNVSGLTRFTSERSSESAIDERGSHEVEIVRLDELFAGKEVNLLKIDVEGYEAKVLEGAAELLADASRRPRALFVELHPYAWSPTDTTGETVVDAVARHGYRISGGDGSEPPDTSRLGWMIGLAPNH